jgi:hypothetical protein
VTLPPFHDSYHSFSLIFYKNHDRNYGTEGVADYGDNLDPPLYVTGICPVWCIGSLLKPHLFGRNFINSGD